MRTASSGICIAMISGGEFITMWVIIGFVAHHIGFVIYYEILTERGLISSIITGYKTRPTTWRPHLKPWKKE